MSDQDFAELLDRAEQAIENEEPELALKLAEQYLERNPNDPDALALKIDALLELDRSTEAEDLLESSLERHPDEVDLLVTSADLIVQKYSEDDDALELALERALRAEKLAEKLDDQTWAGHCAWIAGRAMALLGDSEEAVEAFSRARKAVGDHPELLFQQGTELFELLRLHEAEDVLKEALESEPEDADLHHVLGLVLEVQVREADADRHLQLASELNPEEYPAPAALSAEDFDAALREVLPTLPKRLLERLELLPIVIARRPTFPDLDRNGASSPFSQAVFSERPNGVSLTPGRTAIAGPKDAQLELVLFQSSIERYAPTREAVLEALKEVFLLEVAPVLGVEEE